MARRHADDLIFYSAMGIILGGRLGYVLFYNLDYYLANPVDILKAWGAQNIKQVSLIAAPEGVATLSAAHPDVDIHVAAVDRELNERGYIVPGLGDAGDRQFGTFAGPASEPGHGPTGETAEVVRRLQRDLASS